MPQRIFYDGLNLSLAQGTGIATYTRVLTEVAHDLGHEIGVVYSVRHSPPKDPLLREIAFFDERRGLATTALQGAINYVVDQARYYGSVKPVPVELSGAVLQRQFADQLPAHDHVFVERNLFANARSRFARTRSFTTLEFDQPPDIFHCTYQLPLRAKSACNVYTIHDLVPFRLPYTTLDNKRQMFRLLRKLASEADHIVTVSENSRRDIIELLGVDEKRITNTYESVHIPQEILDRSDDEVSEQLAGSFGLERQQYLLFFGALEPKKNVGRMIEAYLSSGVDIPLVLVAGKGWHNEAETRLLAEMQEQDKGRRAVRRRVRRFQYLPLATLVTLIRGARAVLFPSLYEGFGLPVLEAMLLGTPVVTSSESSLPEIAGDAAVLVDPYDTAAISRAITTIVADADLQAELSRRGRAQAEKFSVTRYRERVETLYSSLR